jgi:predicted TIM-barrel fold metal-dependent hydrolase
VAELIDTHAHWYSPAFLEALRGTAGAEDSRLPPDFVTKAQSTIDLRHRLGLMDEAGVAVQVLTGSNPRHPDPSDHARLHAISNDALAEACAASSGRFRFAATLPLPRIEASLAELERARALPGFHAISMPTHLDGDPVDDPRFAPVLTALDAGHVTVLLHPDGFRVRGAVDDYFMAWSIGAPFEDTIAAVRLMASGVLDRFPAIRWVIPHAGGTLPYLIERMDDLWTVFGDAMGPAAPPSATLGSLRFDSSVTTSSTLRLAAERLGADRLVFGTDFPFVERDGFGAAVARFAAATGSSNSSS